ncbi:VWA domain-containing protein [Pigmentiphaga sp.]|uniref:VWA domain-containing protein n=1 Tax=Pigmentiphaga sp. TaxID=1977564 RepID=UPI00128B93C4|nr:VWA domain-containing protein [Pigmentiphaga sp.]MPS26288.1 VWA domain-containing protein [Alcaligenaceae bacterium SAGV5]MPS54877.1 VWA domain-containing protein [Alcaligenaceae bacterium SAGV3]MPT56337.1 VWA domain-containing protein [Alcaligenaceae bacterium]
MRFLWPDLLWLQLLVPLLVALYLYALARRKKTAIRYASLSLAKVAIGPGQRLRRHIPPLLFLLAMSAALLACARPTATVTLPSDSLTVVLAVDVSRSMQAADIAPNRLVAAQMAAKRFIAELPSNVRLGIVSFAGTAAVVQTPTDNRQDMVEAIDRFQLQRATATGSGLILALSMLFPDDGIDLESVIFETPSIRAGRRAIPLDQAGAAEAAKKKQKELQPVLPGSYTSGTIILLSDGRRTTGPDPLDAARMAAERGVRVYTVGFGTQQGAPIGDEGWSFFARLDEPTLRTVAQMTGGEYFLASSEADLSSVYRNLNAKFSMERKETELSALLSAAAVVLLTLACVLSMLWFQRSR